MYNFIKIMRVPTASAHALYNNRSAVIIQQLIVFGNSLSEIHTI